MTHQPVSILKKTGDKELKRERKAVIIVNDEMVNTLDKEPDGFHHKEDESAVSKSLESVTSIQLGPAPTPGKIFSSSDILKLWIDMPVQLCF